MEELYLLWHDIMRIVCMVRGHDRSAIHGDQETVEFCQRCCRGL